MNVRSKPKIIEHLPGKKMYQIMRLWANVIEVLGNSNKEEQHDNGRQILKAIHHEWKRRGRNPPDPDDFFKWPSTEAQAGRGRIFAQGWIEDGVLSYMGYRVGSTNGRPTNTRHRILTQIFEGPLPPVFEARYLLEWSEEGSSARLQKMAETIAALTRNAKRRDSAKMWGAIRDWENDLKFLYHEYYVERFGFAWPSSDLE